MLEFFRKKVLNLSQLRALLTSAGFAQDGNTEIYGPIVADQMDHTGSHLIQRYITILVRRPGATTAQWFTVRQINELTHGWECTSRPIVSELTSDSAEQWFIEHRCSRVPWARL